MNKIVFHFIMAINQSDLHDDGKSKRKSLQEEDEYDYDYNDNIFEDDGDDGKMYNDDFEDDIEISKSDEEHVDERQEFLPSPTQKQLAGPNSNDGEKERYNKQNENNGGLASNGDVEHPGRASDLTFGHSRAEYNQTESHERDNSNHDFLTSNSKSPHSTRHQTEKQASSLTVFQTHVAHRSSINNQSKSKRKAVKIKPIYTENAYQSLSAKLHHVKHLKVNLNAVYQEIEKLKLENKELRRSNILQRRVLEKYEHQESDLPWMFDKHNKEVHALKKLLKMQKAKYDTVYNKRNDVEDMLFRSKKEAKMLKAKSDELYLEDRDRLKKQLDQVAADILHCENKQKQLVRYMECLKNNHEAEMSSEISKLYYTESMLEDAKTQLDTAKRTLEMKEATLYKFRVTLSRLSILKQDTVLSYSRVKSYVEADRQPVEMSLATIPDEGESSEVIRTTPEHVHLEQVNHDDSLQKLTPSPPEERNQLERHQQRRAQRLIVKESANAYPIKETTNAYPSNVKNSVDAQVLEEPLNQAVSLSHTKVITPVKEREPSIPEKYTASPGIESSYENLRKAELLRTNIALSQTMLNRQSLSPYNQMANSQPTSPNRKQQQKSFVLLDKSNVDDTNEPSNEMNSSTISLSSSVRGATFSVECNSVHSSTNHTLKVSDVKEPKLKFKGHQGNSLTRKQLMPGDQTVGKPESKAIHHFQTQIG